MTLAIIRGQGIALREASGAPPALQPREVHLWLTETNPLSLQLVLAGYLRRPSAEIEIIRAPGGKPVLRPRAGDPAIGFSLSHTSGAAAMAVAPCAIGVDVEAPRRIGHAQQIAKRWFTREEATEIASDGSKFLELWCAKEALAKRHGAGLRLLRRGALEVAPEIDAGRLLVLRFGRATIAIASEEPMTDLVLC